MRNPDTYNLWEGVYQSFSETNFVNNRVFDDEIWLQKVYHRALQQIEQKNNTNTGSDNNITSDYALPFIVSTQLDMKHECKILDFGGGLGTSYLTVKSMLPTTAKFKFTIIENERLCKKGNELFHDEINITFSPTIPESELFTLAYAGSSIHYVENWQKALSDFAQRGVEYMIFSDLPAGEITTFVTTQYFHGNRVPVWFWNVQEFIEEVEKLGFDLIFNAGFKGYYLAPNTELPTENLPESYRLKQCRQLIFKRR